MFDPWPEIITSTNAASHCEGALHPHAPEEQAERFYCKDGSSTEFEYLNVLHAMVLAKKPQWALETGTHDGLGTLAIASALAANQLGRLITVDRGDCSRARSLVARFRLEDYVEFVQADSLEFCTHWGSGSDGFDFAFFDSDIRIRHLECESLRKRLKLKSGALAIFHDTSRVRYGVDTSPTLLKYLETLHPSITFPLSRGLHIWQVQQKTDPPLFDGSVKDQILESVPRSIFDVIPSDLFLEREDAEHRDYIKSGCYYEYYYAIAKHFQPNSILEIGVRFGYSLGTMLLATNNVQRARGYDLESYSHGSQKIAAENLKKFIPASTDLALLVLDSQKLTCLDQYYDLIHIDGDHSYSGTLHDLQLAKERCRVCLVDDYSYLSDVRKAVAFFTENNASFIEHAFLLDTYRGTFVILFKKPIPFR